jgi:hypothetical protein
MLLLDTRTSPYTCFIIKYSYTNLVKCALIKRSTQRGRSLHSDGLGYHERGRLRERQWWWTGHSGLPLQPAGKHRRAEAVLGESHSFSYGLLLAPF